MKRIWFLVFLLVILLSAGEPMAPAQTVKCDKGTQPYADLCISARMADYIACVRESGGNKEQIYSELTTAKGDKTAGGVSGSVANPAVKVSASGTLSKEQEAAVQQKFLATWGKQPMENCLKALPTSKPAPPKTPAKQESPSGAAKDRPTSSLIKNAGTLDRVFFEDNVVETWPDQDSTLLDNRQTGTATNIVTRKNLVMPVDWWNEFSRAVIANAGDKAAIEKLTNQFKAGREILWDEEGIQPDEREKRRASLNAFIQRLLEKANDKDALTEELREIPNFAQ